MLAIRKVYERPIHRYKLVSARLVSSAGKFNANPLSVDEIPASNYAPTSGRVVYRQCLSSNTAHHSYWHSQMVHIAVLLSSCSECHRRQSNHVQTVLRMSHHILNQLIPTQLIRTGCSYTSPRRASNCDKHRLCRASSHDKYRPCDIWPPPPLQYPAWNSVKEATRPATS